MTVTTESTPAVVTRMMDTYFRLTNTPYNYAVPTVEGWRAAALVLAEALCGPATEDEAEAYIEAHDEAADNQDSRTTSEAEDTVVGLNAVFKARLAKAGLVVTLESRILALLQSNTCTTAELAHQLAEMLEADQ